MWGLGGGGWRRLTSDTNCVLHPSPRVCLTAPYLYLLSFHRSPFAVLLKEGVDRGLQVFLGGIRRGFQRVAAARGRGRGGSVPAAGAGWRFRPWSLELGRVSRDRSMIHARCRFSTWKIIEEATEKYLSKQQREGAT